MVVAANTTAKTRGIDQMSINNLIFRIAKDYGITALGEAVGINQNTFKNKVNPNLDTHHVYAHELDLIATIADTDEIAKYFADQRGLMCIKKPDFDALSDKEILDLFLDLQAGQGEWAREISYAMASGDIDWDEMVRIHRKYNEFIAASAEVMSRLECFMAVSEETKSSGKNK